MGHQQTFQTQRPTYCMRRSPQGKKQTSFGATQLRIADVDGARHKHKDAEQFPRFLPCAKRHAPNKFHTQCSLSQIPRAHFGHHAMLVANHSSITFRMKQPWISNTEFSLSWLFVWYWFLVRGQFETMMLTGSHVLFNNVCGSFETLGHVARKREHRKCKPMQKCCVGRKESKINGPEV